MKLTDSRLKKNVEQCLQKDRRLDASDISAEVDHGKVILRGTSLTHQSSALAEEIAAGADGVEEIVNRIEVHFPEKIAPPTDEAIRARIQAALSLVDIGKPVDLVLAVSDGVVFIDGFVESLQDKKRIEHIAAQESGVLEVHNNLVVVASPGRLDEHISR
jgi:osmotically-inducible protein OsmY